MFLRPPLPTLPLRPVRFLVLALSNRAEFRARHGLDISLRLFRAGRLSFHATRDLQGRGYADPDYASVPRDAAIFPAAVESMLQVILVIVNMIDALPQAMRFRWFFFEKREELQVANGFFRFFLSNRDPNERRGVGVSPVSSAGTVFHYVIIFQDN